ncbi:hypothetical protein CIG75_15510 [Tumebacillus algifaecis]|uniref:Calcineurin-like phosphoesterase domain-containing protein n=1 Tax=Tumebacillus algifaecis TaxID=1214604 RepID=A0A223D3I4_9BACL|nr:metallophosphoesterase [Tumebacillus algifaecis]ASS76208.1 hypothetical protein CIG75_15510 [Tumebacillus algifaecis]
MRRRSYWTALLGALLFVALLFPVRGLAVTPEGEVPLLTFAAFSDVHVVDARNIDHYRSTHKFRHALRDLVPSKPDFLVINGDLSNGREQDLLLVRSLVKENGNFKLFPSMGNHEYYYQWQNPKWNDERAKKQFQQIFGLEQLYYDHFEKGAHFIHLSPEQYMAKQKEIGEAAWLSDQQIAWFKKTLLSSKAPTFVFLHQPLDNTVGKTDVGISAVQTAQLLAIAKLHPQVVWFSGHSHVSITANSEYVQQDGITFVGLGSIFQPVEVSSTAFEGSIKEGGYHLRVDPLKSESRFVELYRDRIVIRDRDHQKNAWGNKHVIQIDSKSLLTR